MKRYDSRKTYLLRWKKKYEHLIEGGIITEDEMYKYEKLKKELYTIIADHSHTPFDKVWADSDRDYWMTAQEAKEYGMIDAVLTRKNQ